MPKTANLDNLERAARLIEGADMMVYVTGAGMGIASGLPDFRGATGFWQAYPALGHHNINFTSIASPQAFLDHPRIAWGFYGHRLALYRRTTPHEGFNILKRWGENSLCGFRAFTSNVDGHFQKAGFDESSITECHGSINHLQCLSACTDAIWSADDFHPAVDEENCLLLNDPPLCPHCGGLARPNVYMFGDDSWLDGRTRNQLARLEHWLHDAARLLVVEIGAGTAISTARDFTHRLAFDFDARVIRINPQDAAIYGNANHVSLLMGGMQALRELDALLKVKDNHS